jgi:hypothetical protein
MRRIAILETVLLLAFLLSGCQRALNDERQVEVKSGDIKSVLYDVQKQGKTVRVAVHSPGVPVDAYLVLEKERDALIKQLEAAGKPSTALAQSLKVEDGTLEGRIPAGSAFALVLASRGKDTTVTVKTTESK